MSASSVKLASADAPITIAILAVGGQGGGVLSGWMLALAEEHGWRVQTTSVPGVAQRTGATVYYLEMLPNGRTDAVLALMPSPGAVDIVIAAELMEAGRAIQRGLVAPERTTVISSNHRSYAVLEKIIPGDGSGDAKLVTETVAASSQRFLHADMSVIADRHGSVISAALFGAISAAKVLPFTREAYEQTIRSGQVGVEASLRAFADGFAAIAEPPDAASVEPKQAPQALLEPTLAGGTTDERAAYAVLLRRIQHDFPQPCHAVLNQAVDAVVDFQDARYGTEYLDRVEVLARLDQPTQDLALTLAAARYVAQAMVYDDVIRVADLKTRAGRFARVRDEIGVQETGILKLTEFMHPRAEEVCAMLPVSIGSAIESSPTALRVMGFFLGHGRRVRTDSLRWFIVLYALAGLRRIRRGSLRHSREMQHLDKWLHFTHSVAIEDAALAVQVLRCRRLIKGYADTHARGMSKFDRVMAELPKLRGREDGAGQLAAMIEAALQDEAGDALEVVIAGI